MPKSLRAPVLEVPAHDWSYEISGRERNVSDINLLRQPPPRSSNHRHHSHSVHSMKHSAVRGFKVAALWIFSFFERGVVGIPGVITQISVCSQIGEGTLSGLHKQGKITTLLSHHCWIIYHLSLPVSYLRALLPHLNYHK